MKDERKYALGFVLGQTHAYVEQVLTGAKLAAQLGCGAEHVQEVVNTIRNENCQAVVQQREHGRAAVWIYKQDFVGTLIEQMTRAALPKLAEVWAMGKLFGYSDSAIAAYLDEHKIGEVGRNAE